MPSSPEIAIRNGAFPAPPATLPKSPEAEAKAVSPMKRNRNPDAGTEVIPLVGRVSQWAVDLVYAVKNLGMPTTLGIALLVGGYYGIPWYGEHITEPESKARIENGKGMTAALGTFAEASKANAENQKLVLEAEERREIEFRETRNSIQGVMEAVNKSVQESRQTRQKLEQFLEQK